MRLKRIFYQQKGQFCIDVTWRSGSKSTVYIKVFKSSSKSEVLNEDYHLRGDVQTLRFLTNFQSGGEHTVELETSTTYHNEIVIIKNCSNTCNTQLCNILSRIDLLSHLSSVGNFRLVSGKLGSELIGCQLLSEETNQRYILAEGCVFSKGWISML
jgi:hypothetical protein